MDLRVRVGVVFVQEGALARFGERIDVYGGDPAVRKPARARPLAAWLGATGLCALLAACGPTTTGSIEPATPSVLSAPTGAVETSALPGATDPNRMGAGSVKVALILPMTTGDGGQSSVGAALRNAADLAAAEAINPDLALRVKDDHASPAGAKTAGQEALAEGAELVIGPLFSPNVREVGRAALAANKPVIAFSTDTSTATSGVYLLSFLVEGYVDRIVDYSASRGRKSFAALIPDNDYGRVAEAEFQQAAARDNVRVQQIEHYKPGKAGEAISRLAPNAGQIDALFVPEQVDATIAMAPQLQAAGLAGGKVQLIGTGLWNDPRLARVPALQGAWFPAPDNAGFAAFAERYKAKYGSDPARVATLAYDAVSLAAALARAQGSQRYSQSSLTSPTGFNGSDGVFRFRRDGQSERGLAVMEMSNGATNVVSPAPRSFAVGAGGT